MFMFKLGYFSLQSPYLLMTLWHTLPIVGQLGFNYGFDTCFIYVHERIRGFQCVMNSCSDSLIKLSSSHLPYAIHSFDVFEGMLCIYSVGN